METDIDLKNLWNQQITEVPAVENLYSKVDRLKRNAVLKLLAVNSILLVTIAFIVLVWIYFQPEMLSTKIGITLTISAMLIFLIPYNTQYQLLSTRMAEPNSRIYINQLLKLKEKQAFQQTVMLSIYFVLLSLGIGLYMFEYASKMSLTAGFIVYLVTAVWFAVNWFYFRPKVILNQNAKINRLLDQFNALKSQINTEEQPFRNK